jgi:hypothetical protein
MVGGGEFPHQNAVRSSGRSRRRPPSARASWRAVAEILIGSSACNSCTTTSGAMLPSAYCVPATNADGLIFVGVAEPVHDAVTARPVAPRRGSSRSNQSSTTQAPAGCDVRERVLGVDGGHALLPLGLRGLADYRIITGTPLGPTQDARSIPHRWTWENAR